MRKLIPVFQFNEAFTFKGSRGDLKKKLDSNIKDLSIEWQNENEFYITSNFSIPIQIIKLLPNKFDRIRAKVTCNPSKDNRVKVNFLTDFRANLAILTLALSLLMYSPMLVSSITGSNLRMEQNVFLYTAPVIFWIWVLGRVLELRLLNQFILR